MDQNRDLLNPLKGREFTLGEANLAAEYSATLLESLGATVQPFAIAKENRAVDAALDWSNSGLMLLTGHSCGPPLQGPGSIASCARGALEALRLLAIKDLPANLNGAALLGERAAILQLNRQGSISPSGSCRLLPAQDGWIALNLARAEDWQLLPAWLESAEKIESWESVTRLIDPLPVQYLVERGRLLGLPITAAEPPSVTAPPWVTVSCRGTPLLRENQQKTPLVIDLSALWAGPLCTQLLSLSGARVIKVESRGRPDGARQGVAKFYNLMNSGKSSLALDFSHDLGRRQLRELLMKADIIIESSRPRALQQLGIDAEELINLQAGKTWVSITGYGRNDPKANWVAFGDDAAVAAGTATALADPPLFCGDALADPLTGLHAALAALACWRGGGGVLLDLSLCDVTAHCLDFNGDLPRGRVSWDHGAWRLWVDNRKVVVKSPVSREPAGVAAALGADTENILREFHIPC